MSPVCSIYQYESERLVSVRWGTYTIYGLSDEKSPIIEERVAICKTT